VAQLEHWYLHVDLDAFFASVEQLDHPEYRGKPVIVGGKPEDRRSVVSTASYEARKFGVHSAMPTFQAYKLCPQGIYVHGRMDRYAELSYQIMNILKNYSPDVDQMSIDEAFIDITGTEKLFGPPLETAKKIKAEVKLKTGLTVSIGIAPTKYLAKIASGFQKPDGITFIQQGEEESFMLALPLNKVWGLGPKSLELIRSKGIRTTRDIYELPMENLEFMFGKNMGNYLYEVVRGNEKATFKREAKNHSISAETTFPYDLTDIYTIETELLELAHGVFFRLLKEGGYSRTAFVKIRYDDFTTGSVQETIERNIITLDSYFEIIKRLFEKRYEPGRDIRLLGVGFENIEDEEKPYQQDLFDNNDEKKQAVEKAILNLEKKHPEIKVRKARTFRALLMFGILSLIPYKANAQSNVAAETGAGTTLPDTLYSPEAKDSPDKVQNSNKLFEYEIEGFYQAELSAGVLSSFGGNNGFAISGVTPVFKQEVEIATSLLYDNHWYFNAEFADKFEKNTITIGYKDGYLIKDAKISNRNIVFPEGYSAEMFGYSPKGGQNQAPGISLNLVSPSQKWAADFLIRYDMTESHSATFYGLNKVSEITVSPENFLYGHSFSFPPETTDYLTNIKAVYIESIQGKYIDSKGKHYKQLSLTEYTVLPGKNQLLISPSAGGNKKDGVIPSILVTFNSSNAVNLIIEKTGSYSNSKTFAGKIQNKFGNQFDLEKYAYPLSAEIENSPALVIQNSIGFSPYLNKNVYDFGLSKDGDLLVVSQSTETIIKQYKVSLWDDVYNSINEDFFQEKHTYAKATYSESGESEYPFINIAPELYLNQKTDSDISLLLRTYSPVKEISIGTKAASGTVQVYKNGILESGATYSPETGTVTLSSPVTNTDKIYILWQEDANDYKNGAFTAAAGYKINFTDNLSCDISLTAHWPINAFINTNQFATQDTLQTGYAALAGGVLYKKDNLTLTEKTAVALTKENASNNLLVCSQDKTVPSTVYLESGAGYSTKADPFINTGNTKVQLKQSDNCTTGNHNGIKDSYISGYAIPLNWDFSKAEKPWAAVDIKLTSGNLLKDASLFELALKSDIPESEFNDYEFYLQLGVNASTNFYGEDSELLPCWKLNLENTNNWQQIQIKLTPEDRAKLIANTDARIIVIPANSNTVSSSGKIFIGPYEPYTQNIYTKVPEEVFISAVSNAYNSTNYSSVLNWQVPSGVDIKNISEPYIYASKHFKQADFSKYETINLDFSFSEINSYILQLRNNTDISLTLEIKNLKPYINNSLMHTLTINKSNSSIYIDSNKLSSEDYTLYINQNNIPTTQEIIIPLTQTGSFTIGNLYYSETKLTGNAKNYASAEYSKDFGPVKLQSSVSSLQSTGSFSEPDFNITSTGKVDLSSQYADFKTDLTLNNKDISTAGHYLKTGIPFYNILSVTDDYRFSKADKSLSKKNTASLDFAKLSVPLKLSLDTFAQDQSTSQNQNIKLEALSNVKTESFGIGMNIKASAEQKTSTYDNETYSLPKTNYFEAWKDISVLEFSTGNKEALNRQTNYEAKLSSELPLAKLKPSLSYSLTGQYKNTDSIYYTDKEYIHVSVPYAIDTNNFTINISRTGTGTSEVYSGINYMDDSKQLFELQNNRTWFYTSVPFYELFSSSLRDDVTQNYSAKYETVYKRKLFNSLKDLYVPSTISFTVARDVKAQNNVKDLYQYKTVITNTSVNNLGKDSINGFFNWFNQEEIISNLTGIVKVPSDAPESTTYQLSAYIQALFLITDKSTLTTALDGSFETNLNWSTHGTVIYSRPTDVSFILDFARFLVPYLKTIDFETTAKDLFNIQISTTNNQNKQSYSYQHTLDHKFLEYFTVSTGIGGTFTYLQNQASSFELGFKLGVKAEF